MIVISYVGVGVFVAENGIYRQKFVLIVRDRLVDSLFTEHIHNRTDSLMVTVLKIQKMIFSDRYFIV